MKMQTQRNKFSKNVMPRLKLLSDGFFVLRFDLISATHRSDVIARISKKFKAILKRQNIFDKTLNYFSKINLWNFNLSASMFL